MSSSASTESLTSAWRRSPTTGCRRSPPSSGRPRQRASIRLVDPAGTGAAQLGALRPADALLAVLDAFSTNRSPEAAIAELELELVVADRDHVERRLEKVRRDAKSGAPEHKAEVAQLEAALAHLEAGRLLRDFTARLPAELEPLTTKPLIPVVNGPAGIDAAYEAELAELPEEDAAAFRDGGPSALEEVDARSARALDLVTFFTAERERGSGVDARAGPDGAGGGRDGAQRHGARLHPLRGRPLARSGRRRIACRDRAAGASAARGQELRRRGWRRTEHSL